MPDVIITPQAMAAIRSAAAEDFDLAMVRQGWDGNWEADLSSDLLERLSHFAFDDESISDTIIRLVAFATKPKQ